MRRSLIAGIVLGGLLVVGVLLYFWLRIPPQGSGDDWRVLGRSTAQDSSTFVPEVSTNPTHLLPDGPELKPGEVALAVVINSGDQYIRITDVNFTDATVKLKVHRYDGMSGSGDSIGWQTIFVLAVDSDRMIGITTVQVDDQPPLALELP